MSYSQYSSYKESGIEWLGNMPSHWQEKKIQHIARLKSGDNITADMLNDDEEYPVYGGNGIRGYFGSYTHDGEFVLIGRQGALCGNINYAQGKFWASEHAVVVTPTVVVKTFWLGELLRAMNLNQYSISAAQPGLSVEQISKLKIPFPPVEEQTAIANFLDHETTKIDTLIAKQQRLIELLQEKRQALISHAVTKGLNPDAPMKDSGIEWIGEVPEHWKIAKLGLFATVNNGTTPSRAKEEYWNNGTVPWLASGEVNNYFVTAASEYITTQALQECTLSLIPIGSIIMGMVGQGKTRGTTAYLEIETTINQNLAAIIPDDKLNSRFLHHVLVHAYEPIRDLSRGGNQEALNCEIIASIKIPVPPIDEQRHIAKSLDTDIHTLEILTTKSQIFIQQLQERRSSLISAAVTGKIDVRGHV